jgi:hypothetical protein
VPETGNWHGGTCTRWIAALSATHDTGFLHGVCAMKVVLLETSLYSRNGQSLGLRQIPYPSWEQIEQSIRALDQYCHPLVRLRLSNVEDTPALDIVGGNGKYALMALGDNWLYDDPDQGDAEVAVWTSDQGYRCPASNVCFDVQRVLRIAKQFCESASFEGLDSGAEPGTT